MFQERVVPRFGPPEATTLEESIQFRVDNLIEAFNGFFGKVMAELIAEGQSDPELLRELADGYIKPRRAETISDIRRAQHMGRFPAHIDPELVVDAVFGGIYFQMLLKIRPLSREYGRSLVEEVFRPLSEARPSGGRVEPGNRRRR